MKKRKFTTLLLSFILTFTLIGCAKDSRVFKGIKIEFALTNIINNHGDYTFYYLDDVKNVKSFILEQSSDFNNIDFRINEERETPYVFIEGVVGANTETKESISTDPYSSLIIIKDFELINNGGIDALVELSTKDFNKLIE